MNLETATELMAIFERVGATLNEAEPILRALPDDERETHLKPLKSIYLMLSTKELGRVVELTSFAGRLLQSWCA